MLTPFSNDQFWVSGNVDGIDPTDGEAYGGPNILAGAEAAQFYPTLERLAGGQSSCQDATCANNIGSPNAFVQPSYSDDTNPCARREMNGTIVRRWGKRC